MTIMELIFVNNYLLNNQLYVELVFVKVHGFIINNQMTIYATQCFIQSNLYKRPPPNKDHPVNKDHTSINLS